MTDDAMLGVVGHLRTGSNLTVLKKRAEVLSVIHLLGVEWTMDIPVLCYTVNTPACSCLRKAGTPVLDGINRVRFKDTHQ